MYRRINIRIIPTPEQELQFKKSCGVARWAYNFYIAEMQRVYKEWKEDNSKPKFTNSYEVLRYVNNVLKPTEEYKWLKEVSGNVVKQAIRDCEKAYKSFFNKLSGYPKFKKKGKCKESFYVNGEDKRFYKTSIGFKGEKLGNIKTAQPLPKIEKGKIYSNPRIVYNGNYWYLSVGIQKENNSNIDLTDISLGIDLGVKELAICSNGQRFDNINKTKRVKQLEKRLKREDRKLSRRLEFQVDHYEPTSKSIRPIYKKDLKECKNIQKQKKILARIYKKLSNIRTNYTHQVTRSIVKTKPCRIVMEDLNIVGLMKNKHLSKSIREQKWYEFKNQIQYKCEEYGIEFVEANRYYASSKICSNCGCLKKELPLKIRIYKCEHCGLVIDRDLNASINLSRYNK